MMGAFIDGSHALDNDLVPCASSFYTYLLNICLFLLFKKCPNPQGKDYSADSISPHYWTITLYMEMYKQTLTHYPLFTSQQWLGVPYHLKVLWDVSEFCHWCGESLQMGTKSQTQY